MRGKKGGAWQVAAEREQNNCMRGVFNRINV